MGKAKSLRLRFFKGRLSYENVPPFIWSGYCCEIIISKNCDEIVFAKLKKKRTIKEVYLSYKKEIKSWQNPDQRRWSCNNPVEKL